LLLRVWFSIGISKTGAVTSTRLMNSDLTPRSVFLAHQFILVLF
jgi:hypothetical protein